MFTAITEYLEGRFLRIRALFDRSAWLLIAPALIVLFFIDASLAKTLMTWSLFGLALAGVSIVISRLVFPQIHLTSLLEQVEKENHAAAIVVAAVILFVALVMMSLVIWAKA